MKSLKFGLILLVMASCSPYKKVSETCELQSIHIIDRNGLSETVSNAERLGQYANVDFLKPQSYQKVLRIYGRDDKGNIRSIVTSYHENGQPKQYLEILNTRAQGVYREWHPNQTMKIDAFVIGGEPDLTPQSEKSWLFDKRARAWNEEGCLTADIEYCRGELHGLSYYYHDNGSLWKKIPFLHGKIEGVLELFDNSGNLTEVAEFVADLPDGRTTRFWNPDAIFAIEEYEAGILLAGRWYSQLGETLSEVNHGWGFKTYFDSNGQKIQEEYKEGIAEGIVKVFTKEGFLSHTWNMKDGVKHGEEEEYYTGPLSKKLNHQKLSLNWEEGKIQGVVKTWYENGVQESQREVSNNRKHGLSMAWYKDASLMLIEEYEQDLLVKGEYYKKGDPRPISKIRQGEGEAVLFASDGNFMHKVPYVNGRPEI